MISIPVWKFILNASQVVSVIGSAPTSRKPTNVLVWFGGLFVKRESRAPTKGSKEGPPCGRRSCS